jgi:hypothetical protein
MASPSPAPASSPTRIDSMGPEGRRAAFENGRLTREELTAWAARYPEEIPLVNGELPWIVASLADLD